MVKFVFVILTLCLILTNAKHHGPFTIQIHAENHLNEHEAVHSTLPDTTQDKTFTNSEDENTDSLPITRKPDTLEFNDRTPEVLKEIKRIAKRNYIRWVPGYNGNFSDDAVVITRSDGSESIVCRAEHNGGLIPGKLIPGESFCRFGTNRIEHLTRSYEVLTDPKNATFWIPFTPDAMKYAVHGGHREYRPTATLHVVRAKIQGILTLGKQWKDDGTCSVPFNGGEYFIYPFEILVYA